MPAWPAWRRRSSSSTVRRTAGSTSLTAGDGTLLIQSEGFDSPRDAGQLIAVIKQAEQGDQLQSELFKLEAEVDAVLTALAALREAA